MTSLQQILISGSNAGLVTDKKPYLLNDQAFSTLENAYVWRERVVKRECDRLLGRLRRKFAEASIGNATASPWNILTIYGTYTPPITPEATAELEPGSLTITINGTIVLTDNGDGTLSSATPGVSGTVKYTNGDVVVISTITNINGMPATASFNYFPGLPVMGIMDREVAAINDEQTLFFDTKYCYEYSGTGFQEYQTGTTWTGDDTMFFWGCNYRGANPYDRLFFVTNFNLDTGGSYDPIRYTSGGAWTNFQPIIADNPPSAAQSLIYQAKILIPYYGRLLALNTWEGTTAGTYTSANNYFNRCRFSQLGDPTAVDAWRSDQFGKGGFIDAPTNESITSAIFYKNTLIVFFERTTWQLRYVGEYGLPFIWERISSDYGSESKMSPILFDEGVAAVGDKAIISSNSLDVQRIDQQIPDTVFGFRNSEAGIERVAGVRDFQKQLVYWCYVDPNVAVPQTDLNKFPNRVLVYNYINNTYAKMRNNVTAWGTFQPLTFITWDATDIFWDDDETTWDDAADESLFPTIVKGNQQGYVHEYGASTVDDPSLWISAVTLSSPPVLTITSHNLEDGEIIYITGLNFLFNNATVATDLNNQIYQVTVIDADNISLSKWDSADQEYVDDFSYTPASGTATYFGGGQVTLFPKLNVITKDFNPFQKQGAQVKLSYIDFLTDVPGSDTAAMSVNLLLNSSPVATGNVIVGNKQVEQYLPPSYYLPQSDYAWHRFIATTTGQYIRIQMTYDDDLMNTLETHTSGWVLNSMALWVRPGSRNVF
jgi:hypothetical protein